MSLLLSLLSLQYSSRGQRAKETITVVHIGESPWAGSGKVEVQSASGGEMETLQLRDLKDE